jgi:hypothetical protein
VCAEAITRLANGNDLMNPPKLAIPQPYLALNLDWQNYKVMWEARIEPCRP